MWRWILGSSTAVLAISLSVGAWRAGAVGASPSTCAGCHPEQVSAWSGSRHAAAFHNEAFQVSWSRTESAWCEDCHADTSREDGIACRSCHGDGARLKGDHPSLRARLAHPIRHDPALTSERTCERCHQFSLPQPGTLTSGVHPLPIAETPSQDTVGEWRASAAASRGRTCITCHDPHEAPGAHDHDFVRSALEVEAHYDGVRVTATVRARDAAHAVPTGDPFRRIELMICGPTPCETPLASAVLERRRRAQGEDWAVVSDTRIPVASAERSAERTFVLTPEAPLPPGARWRLVYRFPEPDLEERLSRSDRYFVIDQGTLVPGAQDVL
jgi:hypothetical protein